MKESEVTALKPSRLWSIICSFQDVVRVQAHTHIGNKASQRVLEKSGFKREGIIKKDTFARGEWRDSCLYSILREEWKEPRILTRTEKK